MRYIVRCGTLIFYFMCLRLLPVCVCVHPMLHSTQGAWKRASESLELELQRVAKPHVGAGDRTLVLCRSREGSSLLSHCSSLNVALLKSLGPEIAQWVKALAARSGPWNPEW